MIGRHPLAYSAIHGSPCIIVGLHCTTVAEAGQWDTFHPVHPGSFRLAIGSIIFRVRSIARDLSMTDQWRCLMRSGGEYLAESIHMGHRPCHYCVKFRSLARPPDSQTYQASRSQGTRYTGLGLQAAGSRPGYWHIGRARVLQAQAWRSDRQRSPLSLGAIADSLYFPRVLGFLSGNRFLFQNGVGLYIRMHAQPSSAVKIYHVLFIIYLYIYLRLTGERLQWRVTMTSRSYLPGAICWLNHLVVWKPVGRPTSGSIENIRTI